MRILVLCPHFAPDVAPTGEVMTAITKALTDRGNEVHIVTALPWYREHSIDAGWGGKLRRTEVTDWGSITRLHPFPTDKANIPARALAFGGFTVFATMTALLRRQKADVVFVMSPPLPLGFAGWLTSVFRRIPFVFNIQDVFPDVVVELGVITNKYAIRFFSAMEKFLYRRSDAVTVLSEDLRDNLAHKLVGHGPERVRVIPNFVDTDRIQPLPRENSYREQYGLTGKTVVLYAGNVGYSQSLDLVIEAARRNRERSDLVFVINGGGSALAELTEQARELDLKNLVFVEMQPRERLGELLAAADIHLIPLKKGLARSSVPSKLYSILASARPVLASVDPATEVANTIDRAGAGRWVAPEDADAFCDALDEMLADPDGLISMGEAGRSFVETWVSPAAVGEAYENLFKEFTGP